jgi:phosphoribosylformylglycinamidine synthase
MGIPTVNGAIYFDHRYLGNPLVYCGNIGLIPREKSTKEPKAGDLAVAVGGRTGRDGIHGATFSSAELTSESETVSGGAVQIGNAITEKMLLDVLLVARDRCLYNAVTDCGAGGFSSAVGEMGEEIGAEVWLERVPLKYEGLSYTEIWISEAQERMTLAVPPDKWEELSALCASEGVEATVIGQFVPTGRLVLKYNDQQVADLTMDFLHGGRPPVVREAVYEPLPLEKQPLPEKRTWDYTEELLAILSALNVASKQWVIRQYDHEVQGGSVIKPLVGADNDGPGDAAVIRPRFDSDRGLAISCGMNPLYGDIDPYWMALAGIDEAVRNLVCVGGRLDRVALLDNFCWGDCLKPETMGALVKAAMACRDGAMAYRTPFISGKDSLNNEFSCADGTQISIPPTLLISAITIVDDVNRVVTMDLKRADNLLFAVGLTKNELGGSHYYRVLGHLGANVPKLDLELGPVIAAKVAEAVSCGLVKSCHDCSEGGLAVALAEMAFAGGLGAEADLRGLPKAQDCDRVDVQLFSESNSRYLVEVEPHRYGDFARLMLNVPFGHIGKVTGDGRLTVMACDGRKVIDSGISTLKEAWQAPLRW